MMRALVCAWPLGILLGVLSLWIAGGTQSERPVIDVSRVDAARSAHLQRLERLERVAAVPVDPGQTRELAQAYLDVGASGVAVSLLERARSRRTLDAATEHLYARALVDQGRNGDALASEKRVLGLCVLDTSLQPACDGFLIASAIHRADVLRELVAVGIEDTSVDRERSLLASYRATRQARVVLQ